jgi:predicted deacylase
LSGLLQDIDPMQLRGTLIVVPVSNAEAVAACHRTSPSDGKNLARVFPGRADGTPTEIVAALITEHAILKADALVDLHSAGTLLGSPILAGYSDASGGLGVRSRALAEAFGAPVIWRHEAPVPQGRTISVAEANNIPSIYTEAAGGPVPFADVLDAYRLGVLRVLKHLGMYDYPDLPDAEKALHVVGIGDTDIIGPSPATGICTALVAPGQKVAKGDLCFTIAGIDGKVHTEVRADMDGYGMFVRRGRWVNKGDLLYTLAAQDD